LIYGIKPALTELAQSPHRQIAAIFFCLLLATTAQVRAQDCTYHGQSLEGLPIIDITIDNGDIFDLEREEESLLIHRLANRLHIIRAGSNTRYRDLAGKTPIDRYAEEQLRLLNDQYPKGEPRKGQLIKTVR